MDDIGVRLKGEYSFRTLKQKASFKLKFDAWVPKQRFRGLRRMTFNNAVEDPSFIAERLTYLVFRDAGLPAPRANNAQVYVDGELYGLYVNVEAEDKTFLARWFDDNGGNLYEEQSVDWLPGNEGAFDLETNETANDRSDLTQLFAAIDAADDDTLLAVVADVLDVERFLSYCATEGLVNQWDGYAYTEFGPNNYRLYNDPTSGRFSVLPWGMDMSMKPLDGERFIDLDDARSALLARCVATDGCRAAYQNAIAAAVVRFEALGLADRAAAARSQIEAAVANDPRKEISMSDFNDAFAAVVEFVEQRPASLD